VECWASPLGDCGGGVSREHYISDGIFDGESITAFGLAWCKDEPVTIGLASATSKILCRKHNESLAVLDAEAARLSRFVSLNIVEDPLSHAAITLNGQLIEKWALKTLFNLGYIGALDQNSFTRLTPPYEIVRLLFTTEPVQDGIGLYFVSGGISNEDFKVGLAWRAIQNQENGKAIGMTFTFNGLRLAATIVPMRAEKQLRALGLVDGFDYTTAKVIYRPPNIIMGSETAGRKVINLEW